MDEFEPEPEPLCEKTEYADIQRDEVLPLENKAVPRTYIACDDERMNYTFCKLDDVKENTRLPEVIGRELFDYGVVVKKGEPETENSVGTLDQVLPISYTSIKDPHEGEEWYRQKFPNLPEDFYGIIARYQWGEKFTKKSLKNEVKKAKKKPKKPLPQGLTCMRGTFHLSFD